MTEHIELVRPTPFYADRECATCPHPGSSHSIFVGDACLDCDCPGYTRQRLPDPFMIEGWRCPICRGCGVDWGVERRRVGRIPWKRRVHTECREATQ